MQKKIELGMLVKSKITGYTGTAVGRTEYLHASTRIQVQAAGLTDELVPVACQWCDEGELDEFVS